MTSAPPPTGLEPQRPVALITGATRGLGLQLARALAATHELILGGRDAGRVDALCAELGARPFVADLRDANAVAAAMASVTRLDVLVNNAGIAIVGPLEAMTRADYEYVLGTNVIAVAELTCLALPLLRDSRGVVVMLNSGAGLRIAVPDVPLYSASKYALTALTQSLRLAEKGVVRFISVHPGQVATDMQEEMASARGISYVPGDYPAADEVARLIAQAVCAPRSLTVECLEIRPS